MAYQLMPLILDAIINQQETHGSNAKQIIEYISSEKADDVSPKVKLSVDVPRMINRGISNGVLFENSPGRYKINVYGLFRNVDTESDYEMTRAGRNCFGFMQAPCCGPSCDPPPCCKPCCKPPPCCKPCCRGCCYRKRTHRNCCKYRKKVKDTPQRARYEEDDLKRHSDEEVNNKSAGTCVKPCCPPC